MSLFFAVIPIITMLVFCTEPFINLWLGADSDNVRLISVSTIVITGACILFSVTMIPTYHFLRAKNHPDKEIYVQGSNALVNLLIILLTYRHLGFYSVLLGNTGSFIFSFLLCLYFQKKYLGIFPFENKLYTVKYIFSLVIIFLFTGIFNKITDISDLLKIIVTPIFVGLISILLFRIFKIFTKEDLSFK